MGVTRIRVKHSLIQWAFSTTDLSEETKKKVTATSKWLQPDSSVYLQPTAKQLGLFATRLHIPFGSLLLELPPKPDDIRLAFRTQKNAPAQVSLTVRDIIYEMKRKQAWFKEESGTATNKLSLIGSAKGFDNAETANVIANFLTLHHFQSPRELFNNLRSQLAQIGILNMQKGNAGLGTNRPLNIKELRAFVLLDDYAPLIFINQKDTYTARIFSLVHEFIHILHGSDELLRDGDNNLTEERHINQITAAFLMPESAFRTLFATNDLIKVAHYFNTSPETTLIRAKEIGLITNTASVELPASPTSLTKKSGGNPYNNALSLNDSRYMNALISAQKTL
ncbi:ImmA/IrrE family metallo-endopeptidase [Levilactobacillus fujinensis]|uniref:ImmA/IrrE family metallo-endopeptidase n=1 Tax=Levilactobacillus fujinensis TaxID=2486024 RepID=A0ABW1TGH0_9LACO|nr:ImmA/IrrE family metallo-endopeptidase [Levilactobacillus fujinensis]